MSTVRIGGGSGYWGDSDIAVPQLLAAGVDYIAFDYLAEITMSIVARARARNPDAGYATDFVTQVIAPNLAAIADSGVKILANAGGVNPLACTREIERLVAEAGLSLKVATVVGDDLTDRAEEFAAATEMFSGAAYPAPGKIASINAYLGAFPVVDALQTGADIVVTGRCVDSALALAACIHEFGWQAHDWDRLAAGSLAGHLIECGPQATGGNTTDWEAVADSIADIGYPIAEVDADGTIVISKPANTGGLVTRSSVAEQMLYEIGDPRAYRLPDVTCDFSEVVLTPVGAERVLLTGARGRPAPTTYKTSATFSDGHRIITLWYFIGQDAGPRSIKFGEAALQRARRKLRARNLGDYSEVDLEPFGSGTNFGSGAPEAASREVSLRISARHEDPAALTILLKEASGLALATPPGMALFTGGRPSPSPVVRLFSFLVEKSHVPIQVVSDGEVRSHAWAAPMVDSRQLPLAPEPRPVPVEDGLVEVPLRSVAWGRSGDKGDSANIGVIARSAELMPWIWQQITEAVVAEVFSHFLKGTVDRFYLPGSNSMNFLLHDVLGGGGVASLRSDPQGKAYAEILLDTPVHVPERLLQVLAPTGD